MAHLLLLTGAEQGLLLPLEADRISLGRDAQCAIVLKGTMLRQQTAAGVQDTISRKHAVITRDGDQYYIEDGDGRGAKSRNGTFVNDRPVHVLQPVPLRNGDTIRICNFLCTFQDEAESSFSVEEAIDHDSSFSALKAQPAERLRILLEISNSLSKALDFDALLPRIVDHLFELFQQADRCFIILRDEASGALVPRVTKTRRAGEEAGARFSSGIVRQCLEKMQAILGNDLGRQFPDSASIDALVLGSLMCVPLWSQDSKPLGAIQLDRGGPKKNFTREDLDLFLGVASQASIALSNARLYQQLLTHQRRLRDLELAREVQRALLPQQLPVVPGYEFFAFNESALEVGGDYYDFIPLAGQRLAVLLGDVAGKGVAAALVMVKFGVEARACMLHEADPAAAVSKLNALISRAAVSDRFITLIVAVLDAAAHTVTLVNAGHPSPLLSRRATGAVEEAVPIDVAGPPIGIVADQNYAFCQVQLQPGDRLVLFSDGVTEAMDARGRQFAVKGIETFLGGEPLSAHDTGPRLIEVVKKYAAGSSQHDDITLVCFGRIDT